MPDFSMCRNERCPLRASCKRFISEPNPYRQSYSDFQFEVGENGMATCDHFMYDTLFEDILLLQVINGLNEEKAIQTQYEWQNDFDELPVLFNRKPLAEGLLIDTRRWYETSISVYKAGADFIGVRHITNVFSEIDDYESCRHAIQFYRMEPVQITTYKIA